MNGQGGRVGGHKVDPRQIGRRLDQQGRRGIKCRGLGDSRPQFRRGHLDFGDIRLHPFLPLLGRSLAKGAGNPRQVLDQHLQPVLGGLAPINHVCRNRIGRQLVNRNLLDGEVRCILLALDHRFGKNRGLDHIRDR